MAGVHQCMQSYIGGRGAVATEWLAERPGPPVRRGTQQGRPLIADQDEPPELILSACLPEGVPRSR